MRSRDHKIRLAVSHLSGKARLEAVDYLVTHPHMIDPAVRKMWDDHRHTVSKPTSKGRTITLSIRVSPEEYLHLRDLAKAHGQTMTDLVRFRLHLEQEVHNG
jgi:hypothetical protein